MKNAKESGANGDMPASPVPELNVATGLTKREFFAAMAMHGLIQDARIESSPVGLAAEATWYADALLAAIDAPRPAEPNPDPVRAALVEALKGMLVGTTADCGKIRHPSEKAVIASFAALRAAGEGL